MNILNSKLQVPKRYHTLSRKRLVRSLSKISTARLAAISAGAGYGKTTLAADALSQMDLAAIWYRLDEQDNDFAVFVAYLYAALKQHGSGADETDIRHTVSKTGLTKHTETLLDWLAFLEKTVTQPTVIVLDDYHLVGDSLAVNQAIQFIVDRLPDHIHLILIGRKNPVFGLSKLRAISCLVKSKFLSFCYILPGKKQVPILKKALSKILKAFIFKWRPQGYSPFTPDLR